MNFTALKSRWILPIFFSFLPLLINAEKSCEGDCKANCNTWSVTYSVDCNGAIIDYRSVHNYDNYSTVTTEADDDTAVGMLPSEAFGDHCETDTCLK